MATPRRSARSQNVEINYKEPTGELYAESDSDIEAPGSKSKTHKRNPARTSQTPSSQTKKKPASQPTLSASDSLFDVVKSKPNSIPAAAANWWQEEKVNRDRAVGKLVNLVLQGSGCDETFPLDAFLEECDVDEEVRKVVEAASTQNIRPFLTGKDKANKNLRTNLAEFWQQFIGHASDDDITSINDHPFLTWLFSLSTCQLKEVRHGASVAAMEMMTALVGRGTEAISNINKLDRLVKSGGSSKARNKEQLDISMKQRNALESLMDQLFNSVFVHRTRDIYFEIRTRCIKCLGECISNYKTKFFENHYLKYLGWSLNDREASVRNAAVEALIELYKTEQITELEMFTSRFRERIVGMRLDKDDIVANNAMKLLTVMARHKILSNEHSESVYKLLIETSPTIRNAAAAFVEAAYLNGTLNTIYEEEREAGKTLNKNEFMLKGLIEMITSVIGTQVYDKTVYSVVEALLPFVPSLQDWSLICGILMDDSEGDDSLAPEDKTCLAQFLVGALHHAPKDSVPEVRTKGKKKKDEVGQGIAEGSMYIATALPGLLKKFSADIPTLKALVQIAGLLQLDALTDRQGKNIKETVELLVDIAKKAQDEELLLGCSESLVHFVEGEYPLKSAVSANVDLFYDFVRTDFRKHLEAMKKTSKATATQGVRVKMVLTLGTNLDLFSEGDEVFDLLVSLLKKLASSSNGQFPEQTYRNLVNIALQSILWICRNLYQERDNSAVDADSAIACRDSLIDALQDILSSDLEASIRLQAALALADIVQAFGKRKATGKWSDKISKKLNLDISPDVKKSAHDFFAALLAGEIEVPDSMSETLGADGFDFDEADPSGVYKLSATALAKFVLYDSSSQDDVLSELLATLFLEKPYGASFYNGQSQILFRAVSDWQNWLSCHETMYSRVLAKAKEKLDVTDMTSTMIDSVAKTPIPASTLHLYLQEAFNWALKGMPHTLGFLDVVSLQVKMLPPSQVQPLLDHITDQCAKKKINLASKDSPPLQHILSLQKKLNDVIGATQKHLTPAQESQRAKQQGISEREQDSDDEAASPSGAFATPMRSLASTYDEDADPDAVSDEDLPSATSAKRRKSAKSASQSSGSARKGKKRTIADEEGEDGFVSTKRAK